MALSKTHLLVLFAALQRTNKQEFFSYLIPSAILPDAIRCFENMPRTDTHFEMHHKTGEASGVSFPAVAELKTLSQMKVECLRRIRPMDENMQPLDYDQVAIGDESSIAAFKMMNAHLHTLDYMGILIHLTQDRIYDSYIRKLINCEKRREDGTFEFEGCIYDAKAVRKLIGEFEEQEFRYLCKIVQNQTDTVIDKGWFEKNIRSVLFMEYCPKMAETTWNYIQVDNEKPNPEHLPEAVVAEIIEKMISATVEIINTL